MSSAYESWSREDLISRLSFLENQAVALTAEVKNVKPSQKDLRPQKLFDFTKYTKRKIALKFCYSGSHYNGLAIQSEPTPLPTVEGVLWDALCDARLVEREKGMEACDWSRCGRTDRGVSAASQVVALWVRSGIRDIPQPSKEDTQGDESNPPPPQSIAQTPEIRYLHVLNRILPPTIRVLAWSPVADDFSARFNCCYRHYKYFFTLDHPPLSVPLMQDAASRLVGEHDFRNFCKLDGSKQIMSYNRRIASATISPVEEFGGSVYVFNLQGSAFLWHQVRHIMSVLFLVGQGLEPPSIVDALLNVNPNQPNPDTNLPVLETKPVYDMGDDLPLVLWDCGFSPEDVTWEPDLQREPDEENADIASSSTSKGSTRLFDHMQQMKTRSLIQATIDSHFLHAASVYHSLPAIPTSVPPPGSVRTGIVTRVRLGGGKLRHQSKYTPLLQRQRGKTPEVVNAEWLAGRGMRRSIKKAEGQPSVEPTELEVE